MTLFRGIMSFVCLVVGPIIMVKDIHLVDPATRNAIGGLGLVLYGAMLNLMAKVDRRG